MRSTSDRCRCGAVVQIDLALTCTVLRDPYTAKPYMLFYTTKRVGGGVQDFGAIKVMKFSAS
jgi:HK97 family phage major capsid protein